MPNGVICGGAVDGSNQLGAIVTCHAITTCPDGDFALSAAHTPPTANSPAITEPRTARREHRALNNLIILSRCGKRADRSCGSVTAGAGAVYDEEGRAATRFRWELARPGSAAGGRAGPR